MSRRYTQTENELIEKAIFFLVTEYTKSGFNPKPVIFHSLRVACLLVEAHQEASIVAAAILHDLIEDSNVTIDQIAKTFGYEISNVVSAVSFKSNIKDKRQQYIEMFERTKLSGFEALAIKCADILDNSDYYSFGTNKDSEKTLLDKLDYFLNISNEMLKDFALYLELQKRRSALFDEYNNFYS